ncbi:MAG: DUF4038 domain-containing protein [Kiritimatiellae bacterium]|nr:DUF4038 domain-containing protein [Kiritimatiellia bacterium]
MSRHAVHLSKWLAYCALAGLALVWSSGALAVGTDLRVSDNGRYLVKKDTGAPFFWLFDTGWRTIHRLKRPDVDVYLQARLDQRFTGIQLFLLDFGQKSTPNSKDAYGNVMLLNNDIATPNTPFFEHLDYIVDRSASLGMYVGICPIPLSHLGYFVDDPDVRVFAEWLGARYRNKPNVIWILGGDYRGDGNYNNSYPDMTEAQIRKVTERLAEGIVKGVSGVSGEWDQPDPAWDTVLMTYHPRGGNCSSGMWFHGMPWLDFNMVQSAHTKNYANYSRIRADYNLSPAIPTLDGEPAYEQIEADIDDWDVRKKAYWALFAGACGHTYGGQGIWNLSSTWQTDLNRPGARDMKHVRALIESRPVALRAPDQGLLVSPEGAGDDRVQAARAADGRYALVYVSSGDPVTVRMDRLSGSVAQATWYNPRDGSWQPAEAVATGGERVFTPPSSGTGNDWVLVLDDVSAQWPAVSITSPAHQAVVRASGGLTIEAAAADADGSVVRVEFFAGSTKLGEDTAAPYRYVWSEVDAGAYTLTALATDNAGHTVESAPVFVTVCGDDVRFLCYNDLAWASGQPSSKITRHTRGQSGALVDYIAGSAVAATLALNSGGDGPYLDQGADAGVGTDAYAVFGGRVDGVGAVSYSDTPLVLTFANLDPALRYELVLFGNRHSASYTDRLTQVAISGAASFRNASTAGADFAGGSDSSTVICHGWNTTRGYVTRFADVDPGADGIVTLTVSDGGSAAPPKFYANAVALIATGDEPAPVPPAAPGGLAAAALSTSRIRVTWQDNSDNETVFKIDRRQSGASDWVRIAEPGANVTTCTDTGLPAGTKFYYMVKAGNAAGDSPYSAVAAATTQEAGLMVWQRWEQTLTSTTRYGNPYADVVLSVVYEGPNGRTLRTYGFWDGGDIFKIRCAFPEPGTWTWRTECSDPANSGLHNRAGTVEVAAYSGSNTLYRRGFLRVSANGRYLTYGDGTPFFWLGDTGWAGATKSTTAEWQTYLDNRVAKGFSVVQIAIAPTWTGGKDRNGNAPFTGTGLEQWNPAFWQGYEQKVQTANEKGLVLFLVGAMAPTYDYPGSAEAQLFARNLAARLFGNFIMFSPSFDDAFENAPLMRDVGRALRAATQEHLISNHFGTIPVEDNLHTEPWLSFDMFQSGHNAWRGDQQLAYVTGRAREMPLYLRALEPAKASVNGEALYEGAENGTPQVVRQTAYLSLLSGACGYTYGASGLWSWGSTWSSKLNLPGAYDMGHIVALFNSVHWWRLAPAHERIRNQSSVQEKKMVLGAAAAGDLAIAYLPDNAELQLDMTGFRAAVSARWMSPDTGAYTSVAGTTPNTGVQTFARPGAGDWVLVLTTADSPSDSAPQVDAGPNRAVSFPRRATLAGRVSDDLLPSGRLAVRWQQVSGPGVVGFDPPYAAVTEAVFPQDGAYVLRLTADDGAHPVADEMQVFVDCAHIAFIAYNDLAWGAGQAAANITTLTRGQSGALVNYLNGQPLSATLQLNTGGSDPVLTQGADAQPGTDACAVFGGIVDAAGVVSYGDNNLVLTFAKLDPALAYAFVLFANRAGGYTDRLTTVTLGDADSFVNTSSAGVDFAGPGSASATFNSGENTAAGLVVRFDEIQPGADGDLTVTLRGYEYANALMLTGYNPAGLPEKVSPGAVWRYRKGTAEASAPATAWRGLGFQDGGWSTGAAPLGYGQPELGTTLADMQNAYSCVFMRREFVVQDPAQVGELNLWARYDDGFIMWINGEEVARVNVAGSRGEFVPYTAFSVENRSDVWSAVLAGAGMPALRAGANVLAVQAFNRSLGSGDLAMDCSLSVIRHALSASADSDQDAMPDDWENRHLNGTGQGADADSDGDGTSNLHEYIAGTDPGSSADWLGVDVALAAGEIVVTFETVKAEGDGYAGLARYYALEQKSGASGENWVAVPGYARVAASGQPVTYRPAAGAPGPLFYRVKVWLEG